MTIWKSSLKGRGTAGSLDCRAGTTCQPSSLGTPRSPRLPRKRNSAPRHTENTRNAWSLRSSILDRTRCRRRALQSAGTRPRKSTSRCFRSRRRRWSCAGRPGTLLRTLPQLQSSTCWKGTVRRSTNLLCKCLPHTADMDTHTPNGRCGLQCTCTHIRCRCLQWS